MRSHTPRSSSAGFCGFRNDFPPPRILDPAAGAQVEILEDHASNHAGQPLYLYLPYQSVHMPNEAPAAEIAKQPPMKNAGRRSYLGMISALDEALGAVMASMRRTGLWENTVLLLNGDK